MSGSLLSALAIGLLLGMRHATDSDHVVAVTAIASTEKSVGRALRIGAAWGLGHSTTLLLVGGIIVLFRLTIPPRVGLAFEMLVALMLIGIGTFTLSGRGNSHPTSFRRPVAVGFVHGLAGSAFVALLVLAALPGWISQLMYLALFGLGTVVGMAVITAAIAMPATMAGRRFRGMGSGLRFASGVASIAFGLILAHRVGVMDGLFAATPVWTPK
ncbi:MAG: high-affinity nickel-transport family protein [Gemmatimonadaceae bacterium]